LCEIIKRNLDKKIGVKCLSKNHFDFLYRKFPNCRYISSEKQEKGLDILIGDEILIEPRREVKTACALTRNYVVMRLKPSYSKKQLEKFKKEMGSYKYLVEFGQYE